MKGENWVVQFTLLPFGMDPAGEVHNDIRPEMGRVPNPDADIFRPAEFGINDFPNAPVGIGPSAFLAERFFLTRVRTRSKSSGRL